MLNENAGDSFEGRPSASIQAPEAEAGNTESTEIAKAAGAAPGLSKWAQKTLKAQKQPPAPTLFLGNLGFETTEASIRQLLEAHRPKEKEKAVEPEIEGHDEVAAPMVVDKWIRKIRMGTFEDSGKCKGYLTISLFIFRISHQPQTAGLLWTLRTFLMQPLLFYILKTTR